MHMYVQPHWLLVAGGDAEYATKISRVRSRTRGCRRKCIQTGNVNLAQVALYWEISEEKRATSKARYMYLSIEKMSISASSELLMTFSHRHLPSTLDLIKRQLKALTTTSSTWSSSDMHIPSRCKCNGSCQKEACQLNRPGYS